MKPNKKASKSKKKPSFKVLLHTKSGELISKDTFASEKKARECYASFVAEKLPYSILLKRDSKSLEVFIPPEWSAPKPKPIITASVSFGDHNTMDLILPVRAKKNLRNEIKKRVKSAITATVILPDGTTKVFNFPNKEAK